jgi:alpha-mannosidase II
MLEKLEAYPKMRFIYAEMSYFSVWWNEITPDKQRRVKK